MSKSSHDILGRADSRNATDQKNLYGTGSPTFTIEEGVPIPEKRVSRKSKYPFSYLRPGQSTLIKGRTYAQIMGALRKYKQVDRKRFIVRTVGEDVRVWMVGTPPEQC